MTIDTASRAILTSKLAALLGFDDGADGVLDHLLTIESVEDLLDYLSQLLGSANEEIQHFVESVGCFQRGEVLVPDPAVVVEVVQRVEKVAAVSQPVPSAKPLIKEKPIATTTPAKPKATARNMKKVLAPAKASIAKKNPQPPPTSRLTPLSSTYVTNESNADERTSVKETVAPKILQPEQKGKAKYECGCFGRLHKPLANCLHCGRISCKKEGYDFCPFCEYMVHPVQPPVGESYTEAWARKDRLLQYERENTQRTVVLDDQADHFGSQDSTWLTQEEKAEAKERSDARDNALHRRNKVQLNIDL